MKKQALCGVAVAAALALTAAFSDPALAAGASGTTLAASKTIEICRVNDSTWRYYGEISVWNQGVVFTQGLAIQDCIQNKTGSGQFADVPGYCTTTFDPLLQEIAPGTTDLTADVYKYKIEGAPLTGDIRNIARVTITNHSGSLGTPKGPEPKATYEGSIPPPLCADTVQCGCTYTQGYWGNKPGVVWPSPYDRDATFYLSSKTWQQVLDMSVNDAPGYYQLAHQYIAAVLNQANGACVPSDVETLLDTAENWLSVHTPSECAKLPKGAPPCGEQTTWAGILGSYNEGGYPGGPKHCGDE